MGAFTLGVLLMGAGFVEMVQGYHFLLWNEEFLLIFFGGVLILYGLWPQGKIDFSPSGQTQSPPKPQTQSPILRETVKEKEVIAKIRCFYCGTPYNDSARALDNCPRCGSHARLGSFDRSGAPSQSDKVTVSKKTLYRLIGIVAIVIVVVAPYFYYKQLTTNVVVITEFRKHPVTDVVGDTARWPFTVKVENRGSNDVSNLVLIVRILGNGSELGRDSGALSTMQVGQVRTFIMSIYLDIDVIRGKILSSTATLELEGEVINTMKLS